MTANILIGVGNVGPMMITMESLIHTSFTTSEYEVEYVLLRDRTMRSTRVGLVKMEKYSMEERNIAFLRVISQNPVMKTVDHVMELGRI